MNSTSPRIGILGGGQLGRMMVEAAHRLNLTVMCLDENDQSPAKQLLGPPISGSISSGAFANPTDIKRFVKEGKVDVLTIEIEHVDSEVLDEIEKTSGIEVHPKPSTIRLIQDKYLQKVHLTKNQVSTPQYACVPDIATLTSLSLDWGLPIMLKSKRGAYDGRGNYAIQHQQDLTNAFTTLNPENNPDALYAEKWCLFERELAVMVVRDRMGNVMSYPTVETVHTRNICHIVVAPAQIDGYLSDRARRIAEKAVASLDGAGIFGVEMFYLSSGEILLNEIAPRPHNSGHYTMDACNTSQFENLLRVLANMPIGSTDMKVPYAAMLNILGQPANNHTSPTYASCTAAMTIPGASVHLYGKTSRPDRKLGHINMVAQTFPELQVNMAKLLSADLNISEADALSMKLPNAIRRGVPRVGIIMGSDSDLPVMRGAANILADFGVPFEVTIVSAHRTPLRMVEYAQQACSRGLNIIIAGAGGSAHLPGMVAALTPLPVIGVPVALKLLDGQDSLLSIVQMPKGVPVATVAINNAVNAGLLAVRILGAQSPHYNIEMIKYLQSQESDVLKKVNNLAELGWEHYSA